MNETKSRSKRKQVRKRLVKAFRSGRVTVEQISRVTLRGKRSVGEWLVEERLPPSTVLQKLEALLLTSRG